MKKLGNLELNKVHCMNCLDEQALKSLPDNSIDVVITDPPYGLSKEPDIRKVLTAWLKGEEYQHSAKGFMNREWDSFVPSPTIWKEVFRVLKHGGYLASFASTRTVDLMGISLRLAGFEIKEMVAYLYGSGMPKGLNIGKAIQKKLGEGHELAERYMGYFTSLKPAHEPILIARKPLSEPSVTENVLKWGTGGMNIDACRIPTDEIITNHSRGAESAVSKGIYGNSKAQQTHQTEGQALGRFPSNVVLDEEAGQLLDEQTGILTSGSNNVRRQDGHFMEHGGYGKAGDVQIAYGDSGGASRFFYCAKASRKERGEYNNHPTVKPLSLIKWLTTLLTPKGGVVLEPFAGSGTTLLACEELGFDWVAFEMEPDHVAICERRLHEAREKRAETDKEVKQEPTQLDLFEL